MDLSSVKQANHPPMLIRRPYRLQNGLLLVHSSVLSQVSLQNVLTSYHSSILTLFPVPLSTPHTTFLTARIRSDSTTDDTCLIIITFRLNNESLTAQPMTYTSQSFFFLMCSYFLTVLIVLQVIRVRRHGVAQHL
jgi:hypothetical protein